VAHQAVIRSAQLLRLSQLRRGPTSGAICDELARFDVEQACVVLVERPDLNVTLFLDAEWAQLGLEIENESDDTDLELPRSVLRAVVSDWPDNWDLYLDASTHVSVSSDGIPHLGLGCNDSCECHTWGSRIVNDPPFSPPLGLPFE